MLRCKIGGGTFIDSVAHSLTHSLTHTLTHSSHPLNDHVNDWEPKSFMPCANLSKAISNAHSEVEHLECSTRLWCERVGERLKNSLIEWFRIRCKIASCVTQTEHQATCDNSAKHCKRQYFLVMPDVAREANDAYKKPKPDGQLRSVHIKHAEAWWRLPKCPKKHILEKREPAW